MFSPIARQRTLGQGLAPECRVLARLESAAVFGVDAVPVHVEVDVTFGLPKFTLVGLPDASVRESRDRVRAAIRNSGFEFPSTRVTINLAPADVRKAGSAFDLPIALGVLAAQGALRERDLGRIVLIGELSLDGSIHAARGVLPIAVAARRRGRAALLLPVSNTPEAAVVSGLQLVPVHTLAEAVERLNAGPTSWPAFQPPAAARDTTPPLDLSDVAGQAFARRALEVAAAGGHNLLMVGPPGAGKTMLARRMPGILPALELDEALESTAIHSVAGLLAPGAGLLVDRPFRSPHHTISDVALVGGGSVPRPGEISLAHNGVLFLDEMPEFNRRALEVLRQPIEEGHITIARALRTATFPARFVLLAAMNPCPCGYLGDSRHACRCPPLSIARYRGRLSGPLRDRLDLVVEVQAVPIVELSERPQGEPSLAVRARVLAARAVQAHRHGRATRLNAGLCGRHLLQHAGLDAPSRRILARAADRLHLSARSFHRVLRVARTIADLAAADAISVEHLSEALQYRLPE